MKEKSMGFIGGGRVARIILSGFKKAGRMTGNIAASDTDSTVLDRLRSEFPGIRTVINNNREAAAQDLVFLGLHPPALIASLPDLKTSLGQDAILISLAPKILIEKLSEALGGFNRIVRLIPNAASIICKGYNPIAFSKALPQQEKDELLALLGALGTCPEVEERKLESYAIVTAMGPTYLWFQWQELGNLAETFGMTRAEAGKGIAEMVTGAAETMFKSGMTAEEVMDLIPVKPLGEEEKIIKAMYHSRLGPLYEKLTK